ncbi:hypothetical protein [Gelidibacter maritimus]|uniref:Uncharacterized protein n=1 Tax=Gelidibacter maritimus TaxID=2761487 RepID=A0A7W2M518_9FLAO|nr:hypothetical protein [Gelidibacter maritimus]MBA6152857.1 hypothetical protein [Gelidibacter maritimus]
MEIEDVNRHYWFLEMNFPCSKQYDQFINWLQKEYYFFQQDNGPYLTIYFPNGHVKIEKKTKKENIYASEITVESKCRKFGLKMRKSLSEFLSFIENYHRLSQIKY